MSNYQKDEAFARQLDRRDPLAGYRARFHIPRAPNGDPSIYLCGNSLGPLPKDTRADVEQFMAQWQSLGVRGHFTGARPWMAYHDRVQVPMAEILGGYPEEVVVMGTLTNNIHLMLATFYRPTRQRVKILTLQDGFPSDRYALHTMLTLKGMQPEETIITVTPRPGERLLQIEDTMEILEGRGDQIALVFLPGVHFATGQRMEMHRITKAAHAKGCLVGFDLAHAVGNVPLHLHRWGIDFAVWCGYKYLNAGPGNGSGCFIHQRHASDPDLLHLGGWWGNDPATRFEMRDQFEPLLTAERFQVSNPAVLSMVPLVASLNIFLKAGLNRIWAKSRRLTSYLVYLLDSIPHRGFEIITPRALEKRGNRLSILVESDAIILADRLLKRNIVLDERPPNLIRVAPVPLYNTYSEVWLFAQILNEILAEEQRY